VSRTRQGRSGVSVPLDRWTSSPHEALVLALRKRPVSLDRARLENSSLLCYTRRRKVAASVAQRQSAVALAALYLATV